LDLKEPPTGGFLFRLNRENFFGFEVMLTDVASQIQSIAVRVFTGRYSDLAVVKGRQQFIADPFGNLTPVLIGFDGDIRV